MRTLAGPGARIHFTHLSASSSQALASVFSDAPGDAPKLLAKGEAYQIDILQFMKDNNIALENVCLLDPKAEQELSPEDGNGTFTHFLFGVCLDSTQNICHIRSHSHVISHTGYFRYAYTGRSAPSQQTMN